MKRSGRKKKPDHVFDPVDSSSDTSGSELDVSCSRMVQYSLREGVPGVSIHEMLFGNLSCQGITG